MTVNNATEAQLALAPLPRARIGRSIGNDVGAIAREDRSLDVRIRGGTWDEAARQAGFAHRGSARNAAMRAIRRQRLPDDDRERWRLLTLERQERLIAAAWPQAMAGDAKSITAVRGILDSQSRLLGLDIEPAGQAMDASGMDKIIRNATDRIVAIRLRQREAEARGEVIALPAAPDEPVSEFEAIVERKLSELADLRIARLDRDREERAQPEILDAELIGDHLDAD